MITADTVAWNLATVIEISSLSTNGCLSANRQHLSEKSLISWNAINSFDIMMLLSLFLNVFGQIFLEVKAGTSFKIVCGANIWVFRKSVSGMTLVNAIVGMRPSMFDYPNSFAKVSILFLIFSWKLSDMGRNFVFLPGFDWSCGMISVSRTRLWFFLKLSGCPELSKAEMLGSCGLGVHKSVKPCQSLSDWCDSEILSSLSVFSCELSKMLLNSSFSWS